MIPDEAVAAAAKVIALGDMERTHYLVIAHRALEAAAPHMMAEAFEKGFQKGVEFQDWAGHLDNHKPDFNNPYRPTP